MEAYAEPIIDFKSHAEPYFSDWVQIAGYDLLISKNGGYTKEGKKIFKLDKPITKYILIPFGAKTFTAGVNNDIKNLKEAFKAATTLSKEKNKYDKY